MESTIYNAFLLLGIGMITVFLVLSLVVVVGSLLIRLVNHYSEETIARPQSSPAIASDKIAVLTAVVEHITHGRGTIASIQKMD